jgi:hypothetical protein
MMRRLVKGRRTGQKVGGKGLGGGGGLRFEGRDD